MGLAVREENELLDVHDLGDRVTALEASGVNAYYKVTLQNTTPEFKVVSLNALNKAVTPSYTTSGISGTKILGVTLEAGNADDEVNCVTFGVVDTTLTFIPDKLIYLGLNGDMIQTVPPSGVCIILGNAIDTNKIFFNVSASIKI